MDPMEVLVFFCMVSIAEAPDMFPSDRLSPYEEGRHGSGRSHRDLSECLSNRTSYEVYQSKIPVSEPSALRYDLYRFEDTVKSELDSSLSVHRMRYLLGSIAYVDRPYHTFSVLEPYQPGGCEIKYFNAVRSTVTATSSRRKNGCKLAVNAGYFSMSRGLCLGNIVSDGRIIQTSNEQNANFGIRQDGTIVVGYMHEEDILSGSYRQLISGVIWLVRNGTNNVNESMQLECASHQNTGKMSTFVEVLSARTAVGHDSHGRVVIATIEGQTHRRGANLYEFADLLIAHGVINAINLDGGGSSTFIHNQVLVNYPSDHCPGNSAYRCEREVSTALCFHDVQCLELTCNDHGTCLEGECMCDSPWLGYDCSLLNCSLADCSNHGNCSNGLCACNYGWEGQACEKVCSSGYYGPGCTSKCWCYGNSRCDPVTGVCQCPPGYTGFGCRKECGERFYGIDCKLRCTDNCSENGKCSSFDGTCVCSSNWTGIACNETVPWNVTRMSISPTDFVSIERYSTLNYPSISTAIPEQSLGHPSVSISAAADDGLKIHQSANCRNCGLAIFVFCMIATVSVIVHLFLFVHVNAKRQKQRHRDILLFDPSQLTSSSDWN